ncbi:hypothetical protein ACRB8A_20165 (plasmid) [Arthrobacter sp. G.S.26]|uniref:hypothetical protein n=1 Tax=Arthrobacter sp. G.S.26 TaxID=3433706 RepID=UPI003D78335B
MSIPQKTGQMFGRAIRWLGGGARQGSAFTQPAATTLAADIGRQQASRSNQTAAPALGALRIRGIATGKKSAHTPAKRAMARIVATEKLASGYQRHVQETQVFLRQPQNIARMTQVALKARSSTLLGHLSSWVPGFAVAVLAALLFLNDPSMVYAILREAFDVPTSVGFFDISHPGVLVALAGAGIVTGGLLLSTVVGGKALGWLIFVNTRGRLDPHDEELVRSDRKLSVGRRFVIFGLMAVVTGVLMFVLHAFARARFTANAFTNGANAGDVIVILITGLPLLVFTFEAISAAPVFVHARKVQSWNRAFARKERRTLRREHRLLRTWRSAYNRAEERVTVVLDVIGDTALRTDAEVIEAAIATGEQNLITLLDPHSGANPSAGPEDQTGKQNDRGRLTSSYLPSFGIVSERVERVFRRWGELDAPGTVQLNAAWDAFKTGATPPKSRQHAAESDAGGPHLIRDEGPSTDEQAA